MERSAFLSRVKERLGNAATHSAHPWEPGAGGETAAYRRALDDLPRAFAEEAAALGVEVRRVQPGGLPAFLDEVVAAHGVTRAVVSRDPEASGAAAHLEGRGVVVSSGADRAAAAAAGLGVTGALCGIAATGSVVVACDRAGGRVASLLPPVYACLVRVESLLATPTDFWKSMGRLLPAGPPSQVVLITGPSLTADVEMVLVRGVHGPGHVWVGLLE